MKRSLAAFIAVCCLLALVGQALSAPELNVANDGFEDRVNGSVYGSYQNSGSLLFTQSGNNNILSEVQRSLNDLPGYSGISLTVTEFSLPLNYSSSGTWGLGGLTSSAIDFYAVKAGSYWAMYAVNPGATTGSWSTFDIWAIGGPGTGGHPDNGGGDIGLSHFAAYSAGTSVPEPASLSLLGIGLLGIGVTGRRRLGKRRRAPGRCHGDR